MLWACIMMQIIVVIKCWVKRQPENGKPRFQAAFLRLNHIRKQSNLPRARCLYYRAFSRRKAQSNGLVGG